MQALVPREHYAGLDAYTYLNQASLGLVPAASLAAMTDFLTSTAQHGNVWMSDAAETGVLDELRAAAGVLLDVPETAVAVLGGASEGLGQLAALLASPEREVVLVDSDFPSVTYPWLGAHRRLGTPVRWVRDLAATSLTDEIVTAIGHRTGVVCFSAVQYATGTSVDVRRVVDHAAEVGARVVVDVTQLAGAGPVSLREWGADAVVSSGYKWLSAHGGVALMALGPELAASTPTILGWKGTRSPFEFDPRHLRLAEGARRFELSTMSYASAVGLSASLALLCDVGPQALAVHASSLAQELMDGAEPLGWAPFRGHDDDEASPHLVSLRHPTVSAAAAQAALANGGVHVSSRGDGIRVSLHGYNDTGDLERLVQGLRRL